MSNFSTFQYRDYRRLFIAGLISEMGSFITDTALMLHLYQISGSDKSYLGISRAVFLACLTIGNLLGGVLGEKFNKKNVLLATLIIRAPIVLALAISNDVSIIIFNFGLIALFTGLHNPTRQAMINEILPPDEIPKANALVGTGFAIVHMAAPVLGAAIYGYAQSIFPIVAIDALTYLIGVALIFPILYRPIVDDKKRPDKFDIGLSYVRKRIDLISLYANGIVAGLCIGVLIPLFWPFYKEILKYDETTYGIAWTVFGIGGLIGGQLSSSISKRFSAGKVITIGVLLEPIFMLLWITCHNTILNMIIFMFWGLVVLVRVPAQLNYISETVERRYHTRMFSLLDISFVAPNIIAGIIVGSIGDAYSTMAILYTTTFFFFLTTFPRFPFREMQSLYHSQVTSIDPRAPKEHQ